MGSGYQRHPQGIRRTPNLSYCTTQHSYLCAVGNDRIQDKIQTGLAHQDVRFIKPCCPSAYHMRQKFGGSNARYCIPSFPLSTLNIPSAATLSPPKFLPSPCQERHSPLPTLPIPQPLLPLPIVSHPYIAPHSPSPPHAHLLVPQLLFRAVPTTIFRLSSTLPPLSLTLALYILHDLTSSSTPVASLPFACNLVALAHLTSDPILLANPLMLSAPAYAFAPATLDAMPQEFYASVRGSTFT